jgi:hypothetical protein
MKLKLRDGYYHIKIAANELAIAERLLKEQLNDNGMGTCESEEWLEALHFAQAASKLILPYQG